MFTRGWGRADVRSTTRVGCRLRAAVMSISLGRRPPAAWKWFSSMLPSAGSQIATSAPSSRDSECRSKRRSSGTRDRRRAHSAGLLTPSIISTPKPCPAAAARSRACRPGRSRTVNRVNEPRAATTAIT